MFRWDVQKKLGLLEDHFDPRDAWEKTLVGAGLLEVGSQTPPLTFQVQNLPFDSQGAFPFCASYATTTMVEHKYKTYHQLILSPTHLFFHAGGSPNGSTFRGNLNVVLNQGAIKNERLPRPEKPSNGWYDQLKREALAIPFSESFKIGGYIRVDTDEDSLKQALMNYGPLMVGVAARSSVGNSYWKSGHKRTSRRDTHAVLLVGWTPKYWIIFDSLQKNMFFDGYHFLDGKYPFYSAYAVTKLPEGWKEKLEEKVHEEFSPCLNHYGKPRDYGAELQAAAKLDKEFDRYKNNRIQEIAGRFFTVYINAVAYGGYSIRDMVNDAYKFKREEKHAFNLNKPRE